MHPSIKLVGTEVVIKQWVFNNRIINTYLYYQHYQISSDFNWNLIYAADGNHWFVFTKLLYLIVRANSHGERPWFVPQNRFQLNYILCFEQIIMEILLYKYFLMLMDIELSILYIIYNSSILQQISNNDLHDAHCNSIYTYIFSSHSWKL